jgi:hypothetical protein
MTETQTETNPYTRPAYDYSDCLLSRPAWEKRGYRVPVRAHHVATEDYLVPGYSTVTRTRHLYSWEQVVPIDQEDRQRRVDAAKKAVKTRAKNMMEYMRTVEITIERGWPENEIHDLALSTHGGNYQGDPGPFDFSNRTARNAIRHCLTNYEDLWSECNRGETGSGAYEILRQRVDALIREAYPDI